jgi:hypothetical protein
MTEEDLRERIEFTDWKLSQTSALYDTSNQLSISSQPDETQSMMWQCHRGQEVTNLNPGIIASVGLLDSLAYCTPEPGEDLTSKQRATVARTKAHLHPVNALVESVEAGKCVQLLSIDLEMSIATMDDTILEAEIATNGRHILRRRAARNPDSMRRGHRRQTPRRVPEFKAHRELVQFQLFYFWWRAEWGP